MDARNKYDMFYKQILNVKNIAFSSFAVHVQALLVDYILNVLKQLGATDWFRTWWTGANGRSFSVEGRFD